MNPPTFEKLQATFDVVHVPDRDLSKLSDADRNAIIGVAQTGSFDAAMIDALPKLEIIANFGVGYDGIDAAHAASKGVMVTNTPDVLTDEVADTTLALLLVTVREFHHAEAHLRSGKWETEGNYPLTPTTLRSRTAGIMGLGRIGMAIAKRLEGFDVKIEYHNRSKRDDVSYAYHDTLLGLARSVDTLIVAAPGGASTEKVVNAEVLEALGSTGVLINIGRGTTVDETALIEALESGDHPGRRPRRLRKGAARPRAAAQAAEHRSPAACRIGVRTHARADGRSRGEQPDPLVRREAAGHAGRRGDEGRSFQARCVNEASGGGHVRPLVARRQRSLKVIQPIMASK